MEDAKTGNWTIILFSGTVGLLVGLDLITDYHSGSSVSHLALEGLLFGASAAFFVFGLKKLASAKDEIQSLKTDLEKVSREREKWKAETHQLLEGLSAKIEEQFDNWRLTQAETEVGFLLLKGCSLKEISDMRNTKVKTVQQQSQSIYQKTGLASRSELSAFFLEDLLPPK